MADTHSPGTMLDREFLEVRCRLLDLAAALDRIDRAGDSDASDHRRQQIRDALGLLQAAPPDRAEQVQRLFSNSYDPNWRARFGV